MRRFLLFVFALVLASTVWAQEGEERSFDFETEEAYGQAVGELYSGDEAKMQSAARDIKRLAVSGHARSQHLLAVMYQQGFGLAQNERQALRWFEEAAGQGYAIAMMSLAEALLSEDEAERDYSRIRGLLEQVLDPQVAQSLSPEEFGMFRATKARASYLLGLVYANGWGIDADKERAITLFTTASRTGDKDASLYLAIAYAKGEEVEKDVQAAKRYFDLWDRQSSDEFNRNLESSYGNSGDAADRQNLLEASQFVSEMVTDMVYAMQTEFARGVLDEASEDFDAEFAAELLNMAVDGGYAEAKLWLGILCYRGQGVERDYIKAGRLFKEAADEEWILAEYNLARMMQQGKYDAEKLLEPRKLLESAAQKGLFAAQAVLDGDLDLDVMSPEEARDLCLAKAEEGDARALFSLAVRKATGWLVDFEADYQKILDLYERSAKAGYAPAQFYWGMSLMTGQGVKQDFEQGLIWLRSAAFRELPEALSFMGDCYISGMGVQPNVEEAFRYYSRAAELGLDNAKNQLARFYYHGVLVPKNEYKAAALYLEAADEGDAEAAQNLANCYLQGLGVRANVKEGIRWLTVSADRGNLAACYQLSFLYEEGLVVDKDEVEIAYWQERAAEMGDKRSMKLSALNYLEGKGTPRNRGKAANWIEAYLEHPEPVDVNSLYLPGEYEEHTVVKSLLPDDFSALMITADLRAEPGWSGSDRKEAIRIYERLVGKGSYAASLRLAKLYLGEGEASKNARKVSSLLKSLYGKTKDASFEAKRSYAGEAAYLMSVCYVRGIGVKASDSQQLSWLNSAAQIGYLDAQYELAELMAQGEKTKKDSTGAMRWFLAAAKSGDSRSQLRLARMYLDGSPLSLDEGTLVVWLKALVDKGSGEARVLLRRLGVEYKETEGREPSKEGDEKTPEERSPWLPVKVA